MNWLHTHHHAPSSPMSWQGTLALLLATLLLLAQASAARAAPGAIWTTRADCGTEQQNVNHYAIGETVYVNGANFNPGSYSWHIHGLPGQASLDPGITVASGTIQVGADGTFCFPAYVVAGDDGGEYQVEVGGKHDNYRVEAAPPPVPTIAPPPPVTNTPVPPAPTNTPIIAPPPPATNTPVPPAPTQTPIIAPPPPATNTPVPPAPTQTPIIAPPPPPPATNTPVPPAPTQTPIIAPPPPPATNTPVPPAPTQTPIIAPPPPATNTPVPPAPTQTPIIAPPPPPATNTPVPPAPTQTPIIAPPPPATNTPNLVLVPTAPATPTETPVVIIAPPVEGAPPLLPVTGVLRSEKLLGWSLLLLGTTAVLLSALLGRKTSR